MEAATVRERVLPCNTRSLTLAARNQNQKSREDRSRLL